MNENNNFDNPGGSVNQNIEQSKYQKNIEESERSTNKALLISLIGIILVLMISCCICGCLSGIFSIPFFAVE